MSCGSGRVGHHPRQRRTRAARRRRRLLHRPGATDPPRAVLRLPLARGRDQWRPSPRRGQRLAAGGANRARDRARQARGEPPDRGRPAHEARLRDAPRRRPAARGRNRHARGVGGPGCGRPPDDNRRRCLGKTLRRAARMVEPPAGDPAAGAGRSRRSLAANRYRPLHPRRARSPKPATRRRGRPGHARPPARARAHRPAPRAGRHG